MFKWASKQKDRSRQRLINQTASKASYSPAHSTSTFKSINSQTSHRKISLKKPSHNPYSQPKEKKSVDSYCKYSTPVKQSGRGKYMNGSTKMMTEFESGKKELSDFVYKKLKCGQKSNKQMIDSKKIVIKLNSHNNLMLREFLNVFYETKEKNWNPYTFAIILLKMGFIQDLVNDRYLVKQIWQKLLYPCPLSTYVFLQKIMGNRIDLSEAQIEINKISDHTSVSINSAQLILHNQYPLTLMNELKNRRMSRKQGIHY